MAPLFFTLSNGNRVMVIPDTQAHVDGHPVITYTYSIFKDNGLEEQLQGKTKDSTLHLERIKDPYYCGYITFEKPGRIFSYTANGQTEISSDEVQELIENLTHLRDNPDLWHYLDDLY